VDDYFAGTVQRAPATVAPAYPSAPAYPPYPPVPQQQPWPYAAPPSSGPSGPVIALIAVVATVVVLGVLTAVAIPVFLQQRDLSRRTTVSVPAEVAGLPRSTDAAGQTAEARLQALPGPGDHVAGAFGAAGTRVVVGAARYHLSSKEQRDYLSSSVAEATAQGVHLASVAPGRLGGSMRCGTSSVAPMTICVFADGGSYGVVVVTGPTADPTGTARAAREAFVHRT
jgi:hypothetical protein